jgi:hypothetical protein
MERDRRLGFRNSDRHAVIAHQKRELVEQVAVEEVGPGDGGRVMAGLGHVAIGEAAVDEREGRGRDADLRIVGAEAPVLDLTFCEAGKAVAQELGVALVKRLQRLDRLAGIREAFRRKGRGARDMLDGGGIDSLFHDPL